MTAQSSSLRSETIRAVPGAAGFIPTPSGAVPRIYDEFWTAKQRQMHSLHYALSYRASFKPELPDYFIRRFTNEGDSVGDPFGGRGTTLLQAALLGRRGYSNDINPLSERISWPKLHPVSVESVEERLADVKLDEPRDFSREEDLSMFYHPHTYTQLLNLRDYLKTHRDPVDRFIEMLAISRLHGHSPGFFSAYSFPQISIPKSNQIKINRTRGADPDFRDVPSRIVKKAKTALKDGQVDEINSCGKFATITTEDARNLKGWPDRSIDLIVTSPPFLNTVDYVQDTWLETWFCGIDIQMLEKAVVQTPDLNEWMQFISDTLAELHRVVKKGGLVAMEVGEVRCQGELINLDEAVVSLTYNKSFNGGQFNVIEVYVQSQEFTKLANCFKVTNNMLGTNTNRIVLMENL